MASQAQAEAEAKTRELSFKPQYLISFALDMIEAETAKRSILEGKQREVTELEKGRLLLRFMKMRSKPEANRYFFDHFYSEQKKASNI